MDSKAMIAVLYVVQEGGGLHGLNGLRVLFVFLNGEECYHRGLEEDKQHTVYLQCQATHTHISTRWPRMYSSMPVGEREEKEEKEKEREGERERARESESERVRARARERERVESESRKDC